MYKRHFFILLSLVALVCNGLAVSFPAIAQSSFAITCGERFPDGGQKKPAIDITKLIHPEFPQVMDATRVIAFTVTSGHLVVVASPAAAPCTFNNTRYGIPVGTVWLFDSTGKFLSSWVVAVDTTTGAGYGITAQFTDSISLGLSAEKLIPLKIPPLEATPAATQQATPDATQQVTPDATQQTTPPATLQVTPDATKQVTPPATEQPTSAGLTSIGVSIRADGVCFQLLIGGTPTRYCTTSSQFSPTAILGDNYQSLLSEQISTAEQTLLANQAKLPPSLQLSKYLQTDQVKRNTAISEIDAPDHIESCQPTEAATTTCSPDIIVASIGQVSIVPEILGILVVTKEMNMESLQAGLILQAGSYVVSLQTDNPNDYTVVINGVTSDGAIVQNQVIPGTPVKYTNDNGDAGLVSIAGCDLVIVCVGYETCPD